jgi:hypothetical protein
LLHEHLNNHLEKVHSFRSIERREIKWRCILSSHIHKVSTILGDFSLLSSSVRIFIVCHEECMPFKLIIMHKALCLISTLRTFETNECFGTVNSPFVRCKQLDALNWPELLKQFREIFYVVICRKIFHEKVAFLL